MLDSPPTVKIDKFRTLAVFKDGLVSKIITKLFQIR